MLLNQRYYTDPIKDSLVIVYCVQIADLESSYEQSVSEKENLSNNMTETQARLKRAAKLTTGLGGEQVRWAESVEVCTL